MARGKPSKDGDERWSPNGYLYRRVDGKWRLVHHLIAEEALGRPVDTSVDYVRFKDRDPKNLKPENIEVVPKGKASLRRQIAALEGRIEDLQGIKKHLEGKLTA